MCRTENQGFQKPCLRTCTADRGKPGQPAAPPTQRLPLIASCWAFSWGRLEGTWDGDSQLMVMPSSTPRLLGSFTWKVPLLGMTDSGCKQTQSQETQESGLRESAPHTHSGPVERDAKHSPILLLLPTEKSEARCTDLSQTSTHGVRAETGLVP